MDLTILSFLAAPFVASLVIAGIHAYLGVHVVERGVIFVDLSLAQIAAYCLRSSVPRSFRRFGAVMRGSRRKRSSASRMPWLRRRPFSRSASRARKGST